MSRTRLITIWTRVRLTELRPDLVTGAALPCHCRLPGTWLPPQNPLIVAIMQQGVVDLELGVAERDAGFGFAAAAGDPAVAGAFAGLGLPGRGGGLARDGGQVPIALLMPGPAVARAGLAVQRGAAGPGGQVRASAE